jgi:hypothetical protein
VCRRLTLGNMRSLGVRSLFVTCELCHHEAVLSAERWGDAMLVREFRPRMVCTGTNKIKMLACY